MIGLLRSLFGGSARGRPTSPNRRLESLDSPRNAALPAQSQADARIVLETRQSFGLRVVGASHYQPAIRSFYGAGELDATLTQEPENPYDPNAIRVEIGGKTVGHLDRDTAAYFSDWIKTRRYEGKRFKAPAMVEHVVFDEGEARLFMVGLRIKMSPPRVVGDLDKPMKHAIDLVHRQTAALCVSHMQRERGAPGTVTLGHAADAGFLARATCATCGKDGFVLTDEGFVAKYGHSRDFVAVHPDTPTVSGWEM